jgi:hypothetical protein
MVMQRAIVVRPQEFVQVYVENRIARNHVPSLEIWPLFPAHHNIRRPIGAMPHAREKAAPEPPGEAKEAHSAATSFLALINLIASSK